jgi:hypothetical protein
MVVMPDLVGFLIDEIDDGVTADAVSTDLVGYDSTKRWVHLVESPGVEVFPGRLEAPTVDFNVYAPTIEDTRLLCMEVKSVVSGLVGKFSSDLVVTNVTIDTTPFSLTDLFNNQPRYVFTASIFYRPV